MTSRLGLVIDLSFGYAEPDFAKILRPAYRLSRELSPDLTEWLIGLANTPLGRWTEYIGLNVLKYLPVGRPLPLIYRELLQGLAVYYDIAGSSREPRKRAQPIIDYYKPLIQTFACLEDVGVGVTQKKHVVRAMEKLGISPERCAFMSDSPPDLREAKRYGARVFWLENGYHHRLNNVEVDGIFNTPNLAMEALLEEARCNSSLTV